MPFPRLPLHGGSTGPTGSGPARRDVSIRLIERMTLAAVRPARPQMVLTRRDGLKVGGIDAPRRAAPVIEMETVRQRPVRLHPRPPVREPSATLEPEEAVAGARIRHPNPTGIGTAGAIDFPPEPLVVGRTRIVRRSVLLPPRVMHRAHPVSLDTSVAAVDVAASRFDHNRLHGPALTNALVVQGTEAEGQPPTLAPVNRTTGAFAFHPWMTHDDAGAIGALVVGVAKPAPSRPSVASRHNAIHVSDCNTPAYERTASE